MSININPKKILALFLIALAAWLVLMSCGSVNKNKSSYDHKIDSAGTAVSERNQFTQVDSSSEKSNTSKTEEKKEVEEKAGVKAVFGKHDPKDVTGPVKIEADSSGGYSIDPGGRPLESVFLPKKKKTTETRTTETKGNDSTGVTKRVQENSSDSSGASVKKNETGKSILKEREPFNWGSLIFPGFIIILILALFWLGKKAFGRLNNG